MQGFGRLCPHCPWRRGVGSRTVWHWLHRPNHGTIGCGVYLFRRRDNGYGRRDETRNQQRNLRTLTRQTTSHQQFQRYHIPYTQTTKERQKRSGTRVLARSVCVHSLRGRGGKSKGLDRQTSDRKRQSNGTRRGAHWVWMPDVDLHGSRGSHG